MTVETIDASNVIKTTNLSGVKREGKVRDIYDNNNGTLTIVTTDRHSSFDRVLAHIPHKGSVLNQLSIWWFDQFKDIVANHVISSPDDNTIIAKKTKPLPIEIIVRGYITGVTSTSLWTVYNNGQRDFGDFQLPDGIVKNQKLPEPVLTPTTKSDLGDENVNSKQIVEMGLLSQARLEEVNDIAIKIFKRGQELALERGLILVDTKYEFGIDENDNLVLIDEVHTPDSSRYWMADSYQEAFDNGANPKSFDKEFLRIWFKDNCDPYKDEVLPEAPEAMVVELSSRYIQIFEQITGEKFNARTQSN
ncbi:MAG: phosphoribosylaminoimidazolesuccinocarboxamide synthase [Cyanobacteria bacterium]|nr:phosphoribosylaminoimidazolesuccinocarboxamide synthase [Cyanobacteriota bacterium]MDA1021176.1 phosphoribosylaminoimidazolesuccinocarboxamide synthase [Cyanobacteriota bacterium]